MAGRLVPSPILTLGIPQPPKRHVFADDLLLLGVALDLDRLLLGFAHLELGPVEPEVVLRLMADEFAVGLLQLAVLGEGPREALPQSACESLSW